MAQYPNIAVGTKVNGELLQSMLPHIALKAVDESVENNVTPQDDNELVLAVEASAEYIFTGWIRYVAVSVTPDLRIDFSVPSGATFFRSGVGQPSGATGVSGTVDTGVLTATSDDGRGGFTSDLAVIYHGYLLTDVTAGNLQLRFAQVTTSADDITVRAGSWIRLDRIG